MSETIAEKKQSQRANLSSRQALIIPDRQISETKTLILGAGGIGSNVAHLLASCGVGELTIVDPDMVAAENVWPGYFSLGDVGMSKVDSVSYDLIARTGADAGGIFGTLYDAFIEWEESGGVPEFDIIVVSPDTLAARQEAWELFSEHCRGWWVDCRMGGTLATVYTVDMDNPNQRLEYLQIITEGEEGELLCGEKATAPLTKGAILNMVGQNVYNIANGKPTLFYQRWNLGIGPRDFIFSQDPIREV